MGGWVVRVGVVVVMMVEVEVVGGEVCRCLAGRRSLGWGERRMAGKEVVRQGSGGQSGRGSGSGRGV